MHIYDPDRASGYELLNKEEISHILGNDLPPLKKLAEDVGSDPYSIVMNMLHHYNMLGGLRPKYEKKTQAPWGCPEVLEYLHVDCSLTPNEIAELVDGSETTIENHLYEFGLKRSMKEISGSSFWSIQRDQALQRESQCAICGEGDGLDVHHIIPRKHFSDDKTAHALENLVVLCPSCHGEVEYETPREWFFAKHGEKEISSLSMVGDD